MTDPGKEEYQDSWKIASGNCSFLQGVVKLLGRWSRQDGSHCFYHPPECKGFYWYKAIDPTTSLTGGTLWCFDFKINFRTGWQYTKQDSVLQKLDVTLWEAEKLALDQLCWPSKIALENFAEILVYIFFWRQDGLVSWPQVLVRSQSSWHVRHQDS